MQEKNLRFVGKPAQGLALKRQRVGFLLLDHFSLPAFTQVLDTLVTANLIRPEAFESHSFSLDGTPVTSDLGMSICPSARLDAQQILSLDLLLVCGGLRTRLQASCELLGLLREAGEHSVMLGGLWNGAWFLGKAGLLDGYKCAVHPEHRSALAEIAKDSQVTSESYIIDRERMTAASPAGAFNMSLAWIGRLHGEVLTNAIVDILAFEESRYKRLAPTIHEKMSEPLRETINLMSANLEEPLSQDQIALYVGRSKRQIERLFRSQLNTTPARYYLELRITESRRLLQYSDLPILEVSVACGFISPSHFSKCYASFYGYSPSREIRYGCVRAIK